MTVSVNGQAIPVEQTAGRASYATIDREWKDGDRIDVRTPMRLHIETMPDNARRGEIAGMEALALAAWIFASSATIASARCLEALVAGRGIHQRERRPIALRPSNVGSIVDLCLSFSPTWNAVMGISS